MSDWPKHPDGRTKKMGEMTPEEARAVIQASCQRLKVEFDHPLVQQKFASILSGQNVNH